MAIEKEIVLKPKEEILFKLRTYGLTFFWYWLTFFILLGGAFFFMFWFFSKGAAGIAGFSLIILLAFFILAKLLYQWRKDVCIVTTHRIIDIDRRSYFDKIISEIRYDQVEGITGRVKGVAGTIFRYGDVIIQTAAGRVHITIRSVKSPLIVQQQINEIRERHIKKEKSKITNGQDFVKLINSLDGESLGKVHGMISKKIDSLDDEENE